jgi:hypothetical protein
MFMFFSPVKGRTAPAKRLGAALFALCFVMGAVLFSACDTGGEEYEFVDRQFIPAGYWADDFGGGYDIEKATIRYYTAAWGNEGEEGYFPATELKGDIITAVDFSETSGVLIINVTGTPSTGNTEGKYTGVYYKEYTAAHIYLANPIDATFAPIETPTLNQALAAFTAGNVGTHVKDWGSGYSK